MVLSSTHIYIYILILSPHPVLQVMDLLLHLGEHALVEIVRVHLGEGHIVLSRLHRISISAINAYVTQNT